jgi:hypothetical protein
MCVYICKGIEWRAMGCYSHSRCIKSQLIDDVGLSAMFSIASDVLEAKLVLKEFLERCQTGRFRCVFISPLSGRLMPSSGKGPFSSWPLFAL